MQNMIRNSQIQDTIEKYRQVSPCKVELSGRTTLQDKGSLRSNYYFSSTSFLFAAQTILWLMEKVGRDDCLHSLKLLTQWPQQFRVKKCVKVCLQRDSSPEPKEPLAPNPYFLWIGFFLPLHMKSYLAPLFRTPFFATFHYLKE